jgi:hypothetical protein
MATDKKISDLQTVSTLTPADTSLLVRNGADYQFAFSTLLTYISDSIGAGVSITYGAALPQNISGNNGDVFIHTSANAIAQKIAGTWTVIYTFPSAGSSGGSVLYGLSTPANTTGNNNDTYINTGTGVFYQKNNNVWNQVFSMQTGPAGPPGTPGTNGTNGTNGQTLLNGSTAPANGLGNNGDFYINTSTGYLYGPKSGGAWPAGVSMEGPQGASAYQVWISQGNTGTPADFLNSLKGSTGAQGVQGVAGPAGASGAPGAQGAVGPQGAQGIPGAQGPTGPAGANGQGVPAGGSAGQMLTKNTNTDFDTVWQTPSSGGNAYTLPIATASVVGGVKQGAGVSIAGDGTLSVAGGSGVRGQSGFLPANNAIQYEAYGDSITAGYNVGVGENFSVQTAGLLGLVGSNPSRAVGATGVFYAVMQANQYLRLSDASRFITWMAGLNDLRNGGATQRTLSKISTCLNAFIATAFLQGDPYGVTASYGRLTQTGTWTTIDTSIYGGKSKYFQYYQNGLQSSVAGSTLSSTQHGEWSEVIIGTFTDDGTSPNALGAFEVHIIDNNGNDTLYTIYNPSNKNDGLFTSANTEPVQLQGRMPDIIRVKGVSNYTIKIVTLTNKPTIIDYIAVPNPPPACSPVIVSLIPKMTTAQYEASTAPFSSDDSDIADEVIKSVVTSWVGFPIAILDINSVYNPNIQSLDGLHPNGVGHTNIATLLKSLIFAGGKTFVDPNSDQVIHGLNVGQGGQTIDNTNQYGAILGNNAFGSNQTGADNVGIGGGAGSRNVSGNNNTFVGVRAGSSNTIRNNNTYIGWSANSAGTGYSNVVIGSNAQLPNSGDNDSILIQSGEGDRSILINDDGLRLALGQGSNPISAQNIESTHKFPIKLRNTLTGIYETYYLLISNV